MRTELVIRFDYGRSSRGCGGSTASSPGNRGTRRARLRTPVDVRGEDMMTVANFTVAEGEVPFVLDLVSVVPRPSRRRRA